MDQHPGAGRQAMVAQKPPDELLGAVPVGSVHLNLSRPGGLQQNRGRGNRHPEPAEPATQTAAEVQHTEMQARGRLDEDATATGHTR